MAPDLPPSATIHIRNQKPDPGGEVEVTPHGGRIHFENADDREYRLRLWKVNTDRNSGIDILLPSKGRTTVIIRQDDAFSYSVIRMDAPDEVMNGPIKN